MGLGSQTGGRERERVDCVCVCVCVCVVSSRKNHNQVGLCLLSDIILPVLFMLTSGYFTESC